MGLFSKIKTIFYDDVEEEEEDIKKSEPIQKIEPSKIKNEEDEDQTEDLKNIRDKVVEDVKTDNTFSERDLFRSERTFNFTEFDDDDDIPTKEPQRTNALDLDRRTSRLDSINTKVEKPKVFKPSPVISPIYGILDKDYTKDDVDTKKEETVKESSKEVLAYDTVRRKAYGTLEDDLEDTMIRTPKEVRESIDDIEDEMDKLNEKTSKIEDLISKIENTNTEVTIGEIEDNVKDINYEHEEESEEEQDDDKTISDNTLEHDLFNLIDSMYDDKEE